MLKYMKVIKKIDKSYVFLNLTFKNSNSSFLLGSYDFENLFKISKLKILYNSEL